MKKFRIIILSIIIFTGLIFALSYGYVQLFAKDHIISYLKKSVDKSASVNHVTYAFPFGLALNKITLPAYGKIEKLRVFVSPLSYLSNNKEIHAIELVHPVLNINPEKILSKTNSENNKKSQEISDTTYIHKIYIQNGQFTFNQNTLNDLQGQIDRITLPLTKEKTDFTLRGELFTNGLLATLQTHGWINWHKKDMHAKLTLLQKNTKNEIHADLESINNELKINGELKITGPINNALINITLIQSVLQNSVDGDEVTLKTDFSFQTQLDQPRIEKIKFTGNLISPDNPNATSVQ